MMGDGVVEFRHIRGWFEAAGFRGPEEVEIFSVEIWEATGPTRCCRPASSASTPFRKPRSGRPIVG